MRPGGGAWRVTVLAVVAFAAVGAVTAPVVGTVEDPRSTATTGANALGPADDAPFVTTQDQPAADATVTRIVLHENGSSTWTIAVRTRLTSADEAEEYETFQERFRSNRSLYLTDFRDRMTGVVGSADESLDRSMNATAFGASTRIEEAPQRWGVVAYTFRWDGFAAGGDGRVAAGDVFGGDFFIEENSILEFVLPESHQLQSVRPTPDSRSDGSVEWEGPTTFGDGKPRVVATTGEETSGVSWLEIVAGIGLLVAGLVVAWRRGLLDSLAGKPETDPESDGRVSTGSDGQAGARRTHAPEAGGADTAAADPGPVTDEDRVREVLLANGGRCKQSRIVEELDWSKSKTSRVLSRMAEDDRIEKLRIGRENVIELPGEEQ